MHIDFSPIPPTPVVMVVVVLPQLGYAQLCLQCPPIPISNASNASNSSQVQTGALLENGIAPTRTPSKRPQSAFQLTRSSR